MTDEGWNGKQVLVTGAGGFIGSHLVEALVKRGAKVRAFVRYNSRGDLGLLSAELRDSIEVIAGDLRDLPGMTAAAKDVHTIFHLGALIAIPYSYIHPVEVVESNIIGTLNILLAGREKKVERIVHTSTSEVYGTALRVPIDETHPLQGQSPYSASKIGADKLAESFYRAYDLPVVTLRPFNTFGPRQSARAVIPTIIAQALKGDLIQLGNLDARRDFTFVTDTVAGFLQAGSVPGVEGGTFNLGTGVEIRIGEVVDLIASILGKKIEIDVDQTRLRPTKSEVQRLISDNRLAKEQLNWRPEVSLYEGLAKTVAWIQEHQNLYRPKQYQV
jgi:NAD dependent epimerase/dehydratase